MKKMFDYRLFGATGYCSACSKMIPAFEMVMKAKNNVYHLECFACQQCNHRSLHICLRMLSAFSSYKCQDYRIKG